MVSVRLDQNLEKQLEQYALELHVPKSKLIKDSLIHYFEILSKQKHRKTPYESGSDLFGKYSSGEKDLSVTYKQRLKEKLSAKSSHR